MITKAILVSQKWSTYSLIHDAKHAVLSTGIYLLL